SALIYIVARKQGTPRTLDEISDASGIEKREIGRAYRYVARELGLRILPAKPQDYVPRFAGKLQLSGEVQARARNILKEARERDPMPALKERMAQDVGLDPFGFPISEYQDQFIDMRDEMGQNIFRNEEFLENFYKAFILSEVDDEYQIYGLFQRFSSEFREKWREAQADAADAFWREIPREDISEKAAMLQSARMQDQGIDVDWLELINEDDDLTLRDAAQREFREETGFEVDLGELLEIKTSKTGIHFFFKGRVLEGEKNGSWEGRPEFVKREDMRD
ncbi:transcription initiation factor IIB, partial [Candidatus Haloredivivus sp. G17]